MSVPMPIACTALCRIPLVEDIKQLTSERVDEAKMALHVRGLEVGNLYSTFVPELTSQQI